MINIILMLQFINFKNQFYSIYFIINIILDVLLLIHSKTRCIRKLSL